MTKQDELQEEFIERGLKFFKNNKAGYFDLAMRFGKCRTTIEILKRKYKGKHTVLIAYPDNKLKQTWMDEMDLWGYTNEDVEFVNFSSLKKYEDHMVNFFIIDEFHSCSENERTFAKSIMDASRHTLCLSGTISDDTRADWELNEIGSYSTTDGIRDGILADYKITVHKVDLDNNILEKDKKGKLKTERQRYNAYSFVIDKLKTEGANYMHLALARNRLSLSSIGKMNYLKKLLDHLSDSRVVVFTGLANVADSIGIPSYHSKSKDDESYIGFQEGKHNHLALAAMGKMGVTYTNLDSVILLNFTYNAEESSQILNRAIKLDYKGKIADLHILCLNEKPELKKIKESLSMLDQSKITYL